MTPAIPNPPGWPVARPGILMAQIGPLCFVHLRAGLDESGERLHEVELARAIDSRPPDARVAVLYDVPHSLGISALARSSIARMLNDRRAVLRATTAAFALAAPAPFVRGMLQAVFWIAPPPYPYAMTPTRLEALEFIARHLPGIDPRQLDAECGRLLERHGSAIVR